jgi:hypothetical protein
VKSRREALRTAALIAARASLESQIAIAQASTAVDASMHHRVDSRLTAYRMALTDARVRAAQV